MNFRDTGKRDSGNTISRDSTYLSANDGLLIPACNADKSIVVYDVLSYGAGTLGTAADGGGTRLGFINAGHNEYGVSLIVPAGQGVYTNAQSGNITITYAIVDGLPASLITNVSSGGGGTTTTTTAAATTTTAAATTTTTAAPTNLEFALATSSIAEGNAGTSTHTVTVNRTGNTNGTATVDYVTADITASSGVDYTTASGTLTFAAGVTSQTISITIAGDTGNEDNETFNITLSNPTQTVGVASITGTNPHVVTITNDDTSTIGFALATSSVAEGDSGTSIHTIAVTRSDTNGTASVDYATSDGTATAGTDYTGISTTTLNFADGVGSMNISVVISGDTGNENDETFTVTLTNATSQYGAVALGTSTHTVTITNDDTTTTTTTTTTTAAPGGNNYHVTHCDGTSGTIVIDDQYSMGPISVGDVVSWYDSNGMPHCGTVTATGQGGTSAGSLQDPGPYSDCTDCCNYYGC